MKRAYTQPVEDLSGFRTFVRDSSPEAPQGDDQKEKQQVLPTPPWQRSKPTGVPQYTKPPDSGDALDGKPLSTERTRTKAKPGEDSPPSDAPARSTPTRRPGMTTGAVKGPSFPGTHRQHEQGGSAQRYYEKYYRKNRSRIRNRAKRWVKKWKNQSAYKRDKQRRQQYPERYERRPALYRDPADRSQDWREDQGKKGSWALPIRLLPSGVEAVLMGATDQGITVDLGQGPRDFPLELLFNRVVFEREGDIDTVYDHLDQVLDGRDMVTRVADFLYEKRPPEREVDQWVDRGSPGHHRWPEHEHGPDLDTGTVWNDPGSAKVIPEGHGFENRKDRYYKEAARIADILDRTGQKVHAGSRGLAVKLRRVDADNRMWLFDVPGSKGDTYRVRVKAEPPKGNVTDIGKMDVHVSCSCPFWRWQGPEHWAKQNDYLYGKPVGTASQPVIKDPDEQHWACKHVLAVLNQVQGYRLSRTASLRWLSDTLVSGGGQVVPVVPMFIRVASRYLEGRKG